MFQIWENPATGLEIVIFHSNHRKGNARQCSDYHITGLISCASKLMLKILQARLKRYVTDNFQMYNMDFEKAEDPKIKFSGFPGSPDGKETAFNAGDPGSILVSGRSTGEENGYPLQYTWLDRGARVL